MSFIVGDILFFEEYQFTDTGKTARHFGLVLLSATATKYQNSILCCVITSKEPKDKKWNLLLACSSYGCFTRDSYACFNRKDLVSTSGIGSDSQPEDKLNKSDLSKAFKILKRSLFAIKDLANDSYMRGVIIYQWKMALGLI